MSTKAGHSQARAGQRRGRKHASAGRRRRDRALVPAAVAARVGVGVADLARAMRAAGVDRQLTETAAAGWMSDPETAPQWFTDDEWFDVQDWAFRAAKDLVRDGSDSKVGEFDRRALRAVGVDTDDHASWPVHAGGCDGEGGEHCVVRIEQMRAERRVDALIESVAKETTLRELRLTVGQFVTTWHGARVGQVVKVNKVSVRIGMIGGRDDRNAVVEKNIDPRYVELAADSLPAPPKPGSEVVIGDHGGHVRPARVIETDGPLFEATYWLKSGQWRSGWFDVAAIQPGAGQW